MHETLDFLPAKTPPVVLRHVSASLLDAFADVVTPVVRPLAAPRDYFAADLVGSFSGILPV